MKKTVFLSVSCLAMAVLTGCSTMQPNTQSKTQPSVTAIQQPKKVQNTVHKNRSLSIFTPISIDFKVMDLSTALFVLGNHAKLIVLVDNDIIAQSDAMRRDIDINLRNVTIGEALNTLLAYDCLSYKMLDDNTVYIYKDKTNQCHTQFRDSQLTESLLSDNRLSIQMADTRVAAPLEILQEHTNTNIAFDKNIVSDNIGLSQINVKSADMLQRILETSCLGYRKTGENTLFIYPNQEQCQYKLLTQNELAKNTALQQPISFDGKTILNVIDDPLKYSYYLYEIGEKTHTNFMMKDLDYRVIHLKADNQPAYKVLNALAKANCFDIAELSDKSLVLTNKPKTDKCEPVKDGTEITVQ